MPAGFDVESGAALSDRLAAVVFDFKDWIRDERADGHVTPGAPATSFFICEVWAKRDVRLEGPDIRAMVNYLRRRGFPIASNAHGYFWARTWDELAHTREHLRQRRDAIDAVLEGLERSRENLAPQRELF